MIRDWIPKFYIITCFFPSVRAHSSMAMLRLGIFSLKGPRLPSGLLFLTLNIFFHPGPAYCSFSQALIFLSSLIWSVLWDFTGPDVWSATLLSAEQTIWPEAMYSTEPHVLLLRLPSLLLMKRLRKKTSQLSCPLNLKLNPFVRKVGVSLRLLGSA